MPDLHTPSTDSPALRLGTADNGFSVWLTPDGFFVLEAGAAPPADPVALGDGLFRMARLVDDAPKNPFEHPELTPDLRWKTLIRLKDALALAPSGAPAPLGLSSEQALMLRSSAATVVVAFFAACPQDGPVAALKNEAFDTCVDLVERETHPVLRESLIFHLYTEKSKGSEDQRRHCERLLRDLAPLSPPYKTWFDGGARDLRVCWTTGTGSEGFYEGTLCMLKDRGFAVERTTQAGRPSLCTRAFTNRHGEVFHQVIEVSLNSDSIFRPMSRPEVHIVGYDGHSDIGRSIPASLRSAPDSLGDKLIFYGLCAGKDALHRVRERYPTAQVLTTFTSSYFLTETIDGVKRMTASENFNTLMVLLEDICEQRPWTLINRHIREKAVLFAYNHVMPGGTNYLSPIHVMLRRRFLDSDHDGQADVLDRLAGFNPFAPAEDTAREFSPLPPPRPTAFLDGSRVHLAAMALNTAVGYNQITLHYRQGSLIGDGYFAVEDSDGKPAPVRFVRDKIEGESVWRMQVDARYSHMSVEALRAISHYLFIQTVGIEREDMTAVEVKLMGLVFAGFSLLYDEGRYSRDDELWRSLLAFLNLPASIPFQPIRQALDEEHRHYSGSLSHVRRLYEALTPEVRSQLEDPTVGRVA